MSPRFSPRQLDAFIAVAELANFSLSAKRLNLTPSAVSNLISELELSLGFTVFERTTRKVVLTPEGREFLPSALAVQRQLGRAALAAVDIRDKSTDIVRIAAPMSIAALILPPLIARYRRQAPKTAVRIIDTAVEWLSDRVQIGEADLAIGPDRAATADVRREDIFPSSWVVWCRPDHPLGQIDPVRWADLVGTDVYAAGRDHEHSIRPLLAPGSVAASIQPAQVVDNLSTALGMAAAGLGVTFSPDYVAPLAAAMGLMKRALVEPSIERHVSLYEPLDRKLSPAAVAFRDFLAQEARTADGWGSASSGDVADLAGHPAA